MRDETSEGLPGKRWSRRRRVAIAAGMAVALALIGVWTARVPIADHFVAAELVRLGLPGRYRIEAIGPTRQIVTGLAIGDPAHPDLTIERVEVAAGGWLGGGIPGVGRITLVRPRLRGVWRGGTVSFGSLDRVLFGGPRTVPLRLPDLDIALVDGRASVAGDHGPIGVALSGRGGLRGGFTGALALVAPGLSAGGCRADTRFGGTVAMVGEAAHVAGPLQLAGIACPDWAVRASLARVALAAKLDPGFAGGEGQAQLMAGNVAAQGVHVAALSGGTRGVWRGGALTGDAVLHAGQVSGAVVVRELAASAAFRVTAGRVAADGGFSGVGVVDTAAVAAPIAAARRAAAGTPIAPLLAAIGAGLARELPGSRLAGSYSLHRQAGALSVVVPQARLSGGSGPALVTLSHVTLSHVTVSHVTGSHVAAAGAGGLAVTGGNFITGGPGLPVASGRIVAGEGGRPAVQLALAEYRAGGARLAIPQLRVTPGPGGAGFAGAAVLSGPLAGGAVDGLVLPLEGRWGPGGLAAWHGCQPVAFDRVAVGSLTLDRRTVSLCALGGAGIATGVAGLRVALAVRALDLAGHVGASAARIVSGPVALTYPGGLTAQDVAVSLGEGADVSRYRIGALSAHFGSARIGAQIGGSFADGAVALAPVPLDVGAAAGDWTVHGAALTLFNVALRVSDREAPARFKPLVARGAVVSLAEGRIIARARLHEPVSDREVVDLSITHDLASARGHASLVVSDLHFDKQLQIDALSDLAKGVIADASGHIHGNGRVDWSGDTVTSSGRFASDGMDLAAAFGPVRGVSGTVNFTDLVNLVSAPDQTIRIAAINPGIEVDDGTLTFAMLPGHVLSVKGAHWPFLDGELNLLPTRMVLGAAEVRHYELQVVGIDAAKFLARMDLSNLAATGRFDGGLPLVFDDSGGRIVGGVLTARAPGGSVSYVGALTYKDLSPMANFAFQTLRSLRYRQMRIGMDGSLGGEIVTRVTMRGVSQGPGAKSNFLTRQVARLPLQFNVNIRAPFQQLVTSFRSLYDTNYVADPRGLIGADGKPLLASPSPPSIIQPSDSEHRP